MKKILIVLIHLTNIIVGNCLICQDNKTTLIEDILKIDNKNSWAIVVGISKYKDNNLNLKYSDKDAILLSSTLVKTCGFPKEQIKTLTNENATRENIRRNIEGWMTKNAKKKDRVLIFFSGHGAYDVDNNGDEIDGYDEFLVPYDFEENDMSSAIRDDDFANWIFNINSDYILIVFDSCYSGGAAKAKGLKNKSIKGVVKVDNFEKDIFKEVPKEGIYLLGACRADQVSYESNEFKQGLFTYFIVKALEDKKTDLDLDKVINVEEVFDTIKSLVIEYSKKNYINEQEPVLIKNTEYPFELVRLPLEIKKTEKSDREKKVIENQLELTNSTEKKIDLLEKLLNIEPQNTEGSVKNFSHI